jgi:hypothetical protein
MKIHMAQCSAWTKIQVTYTKSHPILVLSEPIMHYPSQKVISHANCRIGMYIARPLARSSPAIAARRPLRDTASRRWPLRRLRPHELAVTRVTGGMS